MASMIERKYESIRKEIAKLEKSLEKHETKLAKLAAKAEKMDALEWKEVWNESEPDDPNFRKKEHIPFVSAYYDLMGERREVEDIKNRLENANKRLLKIAPQIETAEATAKENERIANLEIGWFTKTSEERQAEYEAWLKEFKAECLKDGIIIEEANRTWIFGKTASGKDFAMYMNSGYTERSLHCYTLRINGETIFTSGDFTTGYKILCK
jgi:hypothetical protein